MYRPFKSDVGFSSMWNVRVSWHNRLTSSTFSLSPLDYRACELIWPPSTRVRREIDTTTFGFSGFDLALRPFEMRLESGPVMTEWNSHSIMGCEQSEQQRSSAEMELTDTCTWYKIAIVRKIRLGSEIVYNTAKSMKSC